MINLDGMISIPYLKKAVFTGSEKAMCFLIRKKSGEEGDALEAIVWPGPFNFATTEDEKKVSHEFAFDKDGLKEAVSWLNRYYADHFAALEKRETEPQKN